ncbi:MAG: MFS transporter [Opitutus sp.]
MRRLAPDGVNYHLSRVTSSASKALSASAVYWTAFIGLFFDYYDLYLFVYLEKVIAADLNLSSTTSNILQFAGIAGVGLGALVFGYLADRFGRERMLILIFGVYVLGLAGLSLAPNFWSVLVARVIASLALGAEWGISHAWMNERVSRTRRYRFASLLQFAILGGLLAALAYRFILPVTGWRWLFAASILPVVVLSALRWRLLVASPERAEPLSQTKSPTSNLPPAPSMAKVGVTFARCLALASLTIGSGYVNVFFMKELPQSTLYTVLFWANIVPGMLLGTVLISRFGVRTALFSYAASLIALSLLAWSEHLPGGKLTFALLLPLLNGVPFGLMGAYFNEVFVRYRTMLSGSAYNFGRILAGFSPFIIMRLGLHEGGNYFLFSAALGIGVLAVGWGIRDELRSA